MKSLAAIVVLAMVAACAPSHPESTPSPVPTHSRYGTRCPHITVDDDSLPHESYSVSDIGKPGFPTLSQRELGIVRKIETQLSHRERRQLRIAWTAGYEGPHHLIVIAPAPENVCQEWMGLSVLNGTCNEFYIPGEYPDRTIPSMGCYPGDSRPHAVPTDPE